MIALRTLRNLGRVGVTAATLMFARIGSAAEPNGDQNIDGKVGKGWSHVDADDCFKPLEQGIRDTLAWRDRSVMSAEFRDWLKETRAKRDEMMKNSDQSATIGWKAFSFGGSSAVSLSRLQELDEYFERDGAYVLNSEECKELFVCVTNETLINRYYDCLYALMQMPGAPLKLKQVSAGSSKDRVAFQISVSPEGERKRNVKLQSISVKGGILASQQLTNLTSSKDEVLLVDRQRDSDGSYPEVSIWVFTDLQDVGAVAKGVPRPESTPTPIVRPVEDRKPSRVVNRLRIYATVPAKAQVDGAGTDATQRLVVLGADGFMCEKSWDASKGRDTLERDRESVFDFDLPRDYECEQLRKLVWTNMMDNKNRPGLYLRHVRVMACKGDSCWSLFDADVNRWLDSKEPEGQTMTLELACPK